jgi:uncharacterized repeat protein (TIGR02543 family)
VDGTHSDSISSYTFTNVTAAHTIQAQFAVNTYILITNTINGTVAKNPDQSTYNHGMSVELTAIPSTGYHFVDWTGDLTGSTNPSSITMDANKTVTANFAINTYTLTVNATNGTVTKNPDQSTYNHGTTVELTAIPSTGYHFVDWTGDLTGSTNPSSITMDGNKTVTANFAIDQFTITPGVTGGGTIIPSTPQTVNYRGDITFTFGPTTGYHFSDLLLDGTHSDSISSYTFTNVTAAHTIEAQFAINNYTLTVNATNGTVTKNPDQSAYNHGTSVELTVTPSTGYHFVGWTGDLTGKANPSSITMDGNKTITGNFAIKTYIIIATAGINGSITPSDTVTITHGDSVTFTMHPVASYRIDSVWVDSTYIGNDSVFTFQHIIRDHTIHVTFALIDAIDDSGSGIPTSYALYQNYPNPFNPTTTISFDLPHGASVDLRVYDILGREIATLLDHSIMEPGSKYVTFNADRYASGLYIYHLHVDKSDGDHFNSIKRMMLIK